MLRRNDGMQGRERGFTLVEVLVSLVIGLLLILGVSVVFISSQQALNEAQSIARMQENLRFAADYLVRDLRNAGFRDEGALTITQFRELGDDPPPGGSSIYVDINDGSELVVRYAGRGNCDGAFGSLGVVENRYAVMGGELQCNGSRLVGGISRFSVTAICAGGVANCCPGPNCLGVEMTIGVEGVGDFPEREMVLRSVMRNRVLESLYN